jgi:membrane protein
VAFGVLLAAVPFTLLLIAGLAFVLNQAPEVTAMSVHQLIDLLVPAHQGGSEAPVHRIIDEAVRTRGPLGASSALAYAWFTARLVGALRSSIGHVFERGSQRSLLAGKLFDLRLTAVATVLITGYLVVSAYITIATSRGVQLFVRLGIREDSMGFVEVLIGRALAFALIVLLAYLVYRHIPVRHIPRSAAFVGAMVAAVLFELARIAWSTITFTAGPDGLYTGALYAVISVVFWAYYAAIIFLLGGEVARVHEIRRGVMLDYSVPG